MNNYNQINKGFFVQKTIFVTLQDEYRRDLVGTVQTPGQISERKYDFLLANFWQKL